ncbi:hypothetical protein FBZ87_101683 [Nitrospirillum amazonense]|uniref:Uncharacterized protein n=1 Tax=Nitrospirillum amazonense TaxID=28077 RepID=A0A560KI76_9PROT|nr:hypothetical protein [Nitrospirillum amazonense]TWB82971.1 hypothetical protein FBZ87_101683 [Nitrospirillum amazonense]
MRISRLPILVLCLSVLCLATAWPAGARAPAEGVPACNYQPFEPGPSRMRMGWVTLDLGPGDNPKTPETWRGPIIMTRPDRSYCITDLHTGVLQRPFFTDGQNFVMTTYADEQQTVFFIEAASCRVLWKSPAFSGDVALTATVLHTGRKAWKLGPRCLPETDLP